jgi:tRNA threonylcarbamoyladenosine biosynthesis protein TsaE
LDAFRLEGERQARDLGVSEFLEGGGPLVVEWPERLEGVLPVQRLWVDLSWVDDSRRQLLIRASGPRYERLLRKFRRAAFGG